MKKFEAVIFDVGGVLAHDIWEPMLDDLAAKYAIDCDEIRKAGKLLWRTFACVAETPAYTRKVMERCYWELFLFIFRQLRDKVSVDSLIALTDTYVIPVPGMREILESLQARGTRLVICSNNNEMWWPRQAEKLDLGRFFPDSTLVLSSRVGAEKGSEGFEMFRAAVAAAGAPPGACFFVDDRPSNVERAKSYGIDAVQFQDATDFTAELRTRGLLGAKL